MSEIPASMSLDAPYLKSRWARWRAHLHTAIIDHGLFRLIYQNRFEVAPGVFRSNQPSPAHLARAKRMGVRTVVNLRGHNGWAGYYRLERDACAALGLKMIDFPVFSRDLPTPEVVGDAIELFATIEYPALFHCKSGADRVGFMSALYLIAHEHRPVDQAMDQLSLRYGHWRQAKTGVLDCFFRAYRDYRRRTGGDFATWVAEQYDRDALKQDFHDNRWVTLLVDRVLMRE
jgi:protein tyrosine/serine phosphatase